MITVCSIYDLAKYRRGTVCRTSVGATKGMDQYKDLWFLAPTKELRDGHKYHGQSEQWYRDGYRALMQERWVDVKGWLDSLQPDVDLTLLCYCSEGKFCHRRIIAAMVKHYRPVIEVVVH
jgi:uncharacterized protein YeaO (DUF488 family)